MVCSIPFVSQLRRGNQKGTCGSSRGTVEITHILNKAPTPTDPYSFETDDLEPETWNQLNSSLGDANAGAIVSCTIAHRNGSSRRINVGCTQRPHRSTCQSSPRRHDPIILGCYRNYAKRGVYLQPTWSIPPASRSSLSVAFRTFITRYDCSGTPSEQFGKIRSQPHQAQRLLH